MNYFLVHLTFRLVSDARLSCDKHVIFNTESTLLHEFTSLPTGNSLFSDSLSLSGASIKKSESMVHRSRHKHMLLNTEKHNLLTHQLLVSWKISSTFLNYLQSHCHKLHGSINYQHFNYIYILVDKELKIEFCLTLHFVIYYNPPPVVVSLLTFDETELFCNRLICC